MIAAIIELDHEAGREYFADVGNSPQPSWDRREDGMRAFLAHWERHGAILEQVIVPRLTATLGRSDMVETIRLQQRQVVERTGDLVRRAPQHDADGRWLTDFEELKALFDAQCLREMTELIPLVLDRVPAEEVAEMTRQARAMHKTRAP